MHSRFDQSTFRNVCSLVKVALNSFNLIISPFACVAIDADDNIQRTLLLLKPDTVQRGLIGKVIGRLESKGLKLVGMKFVWVNICH